jgi:hypothetical protein
MIRALSAPATSRARTSHPRDVTDSSATDDTDSPNEGKSVNHFDSKDLVTKS